MLLRVGVCGRQTLRRRLCESVLRSFLGLDPVNEGQRWRIGQGEKCVCRVLPELPTGTSGAGTAPRSCAQLKEEALPTPVSNWWALSPEGGLTLGLL